MITFSQRVGLLIAVVHFVTDDENPPASRTMWRDALPPAISGSRPAHC